MRLWHKDLISVLPRQQLLGQWRECCAIMANIAKNGTPNHVLVNKIMDYDKKHFLTYAMCVRDEMLDRGYRCNWSKFEDLYKLTYGKGLIGLAFKCEIFEGWMNDRYLTQCYYNLQEKYDCGAIKDDEWERVEKQYMKLMWKAIITEKERKNANQSVLERLDQSDDY